MKEPRSVSVSSFGPEWKARYGRLAHDYGYCWPDTREIVIDRGAERAGKLREIIIHEMLHKLMPWLEEDCVRIAAEEIDAALDAFEELQDSE